MRALLLAAVLALGVLAAPALRAQTDAAPAPTGGVLWAGDQTEGPITHLPSGLVFPEAFGTLRRREYQTEPNPISADVTGVAYGADDRFRVVITLVPAAGMPDSSAEATPIERYFGVMLRVLQSRNPGATFVEPTPTVIPYADGTVPVHFAWLITADERIGELLFTFVLDGQLVYIRGTHPATDEAAALVSAEIPGLLQGILHQTPGGAP